MAGEMIERVAQVLCRAANPMEGLRQPWAYLGSAQEPWRVSAMAAIAAMRQPTEAMLGAANRLNHPRDIEIWRAMIDEALKP